MRTVRIARSAERGARSTEFDLLFRAPRSALRALVAATIVALFVGGRASADDKPSFTTQTLRGRVVYLAEAVEKQLGVRSVAEAKERILALQTASGELVPLLEDVRARALRRDQRLRDMELELLVRRYRQSPAVQ